MVIHTGKPKAVAWVRGEGRLRGSVTFYPVREGTLVAAEIFGLPKTASGFFAFHIHEGGSCGGKDFAGTGGHLNPEGKAHPEHMGDLPPLLAVDGKAYMAVETGRFTPEDVIGHTVVIHMDPDDFHTQPAGNAGRKIACGVIRRI